MLIRKLAPIVTATLLLTGTKASAVGWEHYDRNPDFEPQVLPSGAVANFDDWKRVMPYSRVGPGIEVAPRLVTDKVWMFDGIFYAPVVIETEEGLLVFSTGENAEEGTLFRKLIREQISEKPIIGVFYDHAHYPFGAATLLDGDEAIIVAHPDHNRIIRESGLLANPIIPEMLPHMDGRADIHFGNSHPKKGADAPIGTVSLSFDKERAWLPATRTLEHGEIITVGGVEIQAFHAVTDTEDTLTFWLPEKKLVIDNAVWPTIPNIYTLRGDRFRPPMLWVQALKDIRDLKPEIVLDVGGGAKAMEGADFIQESLTALIDTKEPVISSVVMSDSALKVGETSTLTITFSEAVNNFDNSDITLANGTPSAWATIPATVNLPGLGLVGSLGICHHQHIRLCDQPGSSCTTPSRPAR